MVRLLTRMLAVFVIFGLVAPPMVAQGARSYVAAELGARIVSVSADMPCCPDDQARNGCKECPLANCVLQLAQDQPSQADGIVVELGTIRLRRAPNDLIADGLFGDPPDHPPRFLI